MDEDSQRRNDVAATQPAASQQPKQADALDSQAHGEAISKTASNTNRESKRIDQASLAKLVAEENASKSKFPNYPGLERWELLEKMGDGAFSNVYRARDLQGTYGEVAIKVVRKYEMNSMQVSGAQPLAVYMWPMISLLSLLPLPTTSLSF